MNPQIAIHHLKLSRVRERNKSEILNEYCWLHVGRIQQLYIPAFGSSMEMKGEGVVRFAFQNINRIRLDSDTESEEIDAMETFDIDWCSRTSWNKYKLVAIEVVAQWSSFSYLAKVQHRGPKTTCVVPQWWVHCTKRMHGIIQVLICQSFAWQSYHSRFCHSCSLALLRANSQDFFAGHFCHGQELNPGPLWCTFAK